MTKFETPKFNSKANNKKYEQNYDRIFKQKPKETNKVKEK